MKEKILEISNKLNNNDITEKEAQEQLLFLFGVSNQRKKLLIAYTKWLSEQKKFSIYSSSMVDAFLGTL